MRQGNRLPVLTLHASDDGVPVDLTAASNVQLVAYQNGAQLFSTALTGGTSGGVVTYAWGASDTAVAARIFARLDVTSAGKVQTYPATGFVEIDVIPLTP